MVLASSWRLGGVVCEGEIQGRSNSRLGDPWPGGASAPAHVHTRKGYLCRCGLVYRHMGGHACTQHMRLHAYSCAHKQTTHWHIHTSTYMAQVCTCTHRQTSVSPVRKGPLGPSADKEGCAGPPRPEQLLGEPPYCLHPGTHMPTLEQMLQALFPGPVLLGSGKSLEPCFSDMLLGTSGKPGGARDRQGVRARQAGCSWRGHTCGPCFLWTAADGAPPEMLPQLLDTALPAPSSVEWCPTLP